MPALRWRRHVDNAPVISNIAAVQVSESVVRVSWDVDQHVQGQIEYGDDPGGPYPNLTTLEDSFDYASHIQQIEGLTPGQTVYFRVLAWNAAGEQSTSDEQSYDLEAPDAAIEYDDYTVTTGAGWTDGSDARANLQTFIAGKPNGTDATHHTRIIFPAGFTWTISSAILVTGRSYITFWGSGTPVHTVDADGLITATGNTGGGKIKITSTASTGSSAGHRACFSTLSGAPGSSYRAVGLRWTLMQFEGSMTATHDRTTNMAGAGTEQQHSVAMYGGDDIEFDRNNTYRLTGDGFYAAGAAGSVTGANADNTVFTDPGDVRSRNIRIHHNHIRSCGRVGVAIIKASDVIISDNRFEDASYAAVDYEPNYYHERIGNNAILRNSFVGRFNWDVTYVMYTIYITRPSSRPVGLGFRIDGTTTIADNVFASQHGRNSNGTSAAITSGIPDIGRIDGSVFEKTAHLTITGNKRILYPYPGPAVGLNSWKAGWTITGNTGFGATGAFVSLGSGNSGSPQTVSGNT